MDRQEQRSFDTSNTVQSRELDLLMNSLCSIREDPEEEYDPPQDFELEVIDDLPIGMAEVEEEATESDASPEERVQEDQQSSAVRTQTSATDSSPLPPPQPPPTRQ